MGSCNNRHARRRDYAAMLGNGDPRDCSRSLGPSTTLLFTHWSRGMVVASESLKNETTAAPKFRSDMQRSYARRHSFSQQFELVETERLSATEQNASRSRPSSPAPTAHGATTRSYFLPLRKAPSQDISPPKRADTQTNQIPATQLPIQLAHFKSQTLTLQMPRHSN